MMQCNFKLSVQNFCFVLKKKKFHVSLSVTFRYLTLKKIDIYTLSGCNLKSASQNHHGTWVSTYKYQV